FFFQAEDGIRDFHVTGVQTCALPISTGVKTSKWWPARKHPKPRSGPPRLQELLQHLLRGGAVLQRGHRAGSPALAQATHGVRVEIGRASCREGWTCLDDRAATERTAA